VIEFCIVAATLGDPYLHSTVASCAPHAALTTVSTARVCSSATGQSFGRVLKFSTARTKHAGSADFFARHEYAAHNSPKCRACRTVPRLRQSRLSR
jgi:hypothetical protein